MEEYISSKKMNGGIYSICVWYPSCLSLGACCWFAAECWCWWIGLLEYGGEGVTRRQFCAPENSFSANHGIRYSIWISFVMIILLTLLKKKKKRKKITHFSAQMEFALPLGILFLHCQRKSKHWAFGHETIEQAKCYFENL